MNERIRFELPQNTGITCPCRCGCEMELLRISLEWEQLDNTGVWFDCGWGAWYECDECGDEYEADISFHFDEWQEEARQQALNFLYPPDPPISENQPPLF